MDTKIRTEVVQAAQKIIFGNEGNYSSVNANDNGAVSVGKVQWHAGRALALLKKICAAESGAVSILGAALYNEITTAASGHNFSEVKQKIFAEIVCFFQREKLGNRHNDLAPYTYTPQGNRVLKGF